jgi:16S rRNA processing protein RimM
LGAVIAAHGIKGEVKVRTFTSSPDALSAYGPLATDKGRALTIVSLNPVKGDEAIVRFEGIDDRNQAETLKGQQLFVARASLPEPAADEFYLADLVGLRVEDVAGAHLGKVRAVHNFGAGDIIELARAGGGTDFIPFNSSVTREIDVAKGRIVIEPPSYEEKG